MKDSEDDAFGYFRDALILPFSAMFINLGTTAMPDLQRHLKRQSFKRVLNTS